MDVPESAKVYRYLCPLHGRSADECLMAAITSYWDDSSGASVQTVVGFVASVDVWERFDKGWNRVLEKFHLRRSHMTDFAAQRGEYEHGWNDPQKRSDYIAQLLSVASECDLRGVGASVIVPALDKCNEHWRRGFSPYAVAVALTAESFCDYFGKEQEASIFLDRIVNGRSELDAAGAILNSDPLYTDWWQEENVSLQHLTKDEMKQDIRAKEAADLVAWETRINAAGLYGYTNRAAGSHWSGKRESLMAIGQHVPVNGFIHDEAKLIDLYTRLKPYNGGE